MPESPVQGYVLHTIAIEENTLYRREGHICQILRRHTEASDLDVLEFGPAFVVRFGDGFVTVVHSNELNPWYPT